MKLLALFVLALLPVLLFSEGQASGPLAYGAEYRPEYGLDVSFDISRSRIMGIVRVPVRAGRGETFQTGTLTVSRVEVNGRPVAFSREGGALGITPSEDGVMEIRYEGVFQGGPSAGKGDDDRNDCVIDGRGIALAGLWYPRPAGLAIYRLKAALPRGYEAVSEAETVGKVTRGTGLEFQFAFSHPVDGISLVASDRWAVTTDRAGAVELVAYFFKEDQKLAGTYLERAKKYLALYEKLLTPYPYRRFAIVENFLPTGMSLPTFTLLGRDVVRLPFILETSFGHEILHQWFGNSVYSDYARGNWAEGLTTYLADHLYEEERGKGWEYRRQLLINFASYVDPAHDFPLREFRSRQDYASQAIGYGKAVLVFHMLRRMSGDERFFAALQDFLRERQYQLASWDDLQRAFEKRTGRDLALFFRQWLDGKGLPEVRLEHVLVSPQGPQWEVSFDVLRKDSLVALDLPLVVTFRGGGVKKDVLTLEGEKKRVSILTEEEPVALTLDGEYDLARTLAEAEMPPVLARLLGDEQVIIVLPEKDQERYAAVREGFRRKDVAERAAPGLKDEEIKAASLIILGRENPVLRRLFGRLAPATAGFDLTVRKNPWNREKVVGIIQAGSAAEAKAAMGKISHYGKYSSLAFDGGKNVSMQTEPAARGIRAELPGEPPALDLSSLQVLSRAIEAVSAKKIVYVGENHEQFSHHDTQLKIIQALHKENRKLAIGMEMFQRPYQQALDEYIGGVLDEREFLIRSEYFKRWVFDYNLYKPILDFARAEKIPVVALNLRREITEKVSREGMDSLTEAQRQELPKEMDFSAEAYGKRLRQVFGQHKNPESRNFDFFLQAQVLWDETMAQSVDEYLKQHPDGQMVVIAGGGHVIFGDGIPKRAFRRNGLSYAVILNDGEVEEGIADYCVFPPSREGLTAPRLLVQFQEEGKLTIEGFAKDSVAEKAGLKAGDVVVALDGAAVRSLPEVRLALFYKKKGESLRVSVIRKHASSGEETMDVEVKL